MIEGDEKHIVGGWLSKNGHVVADDVCKRIEILTSTYLNKIVSDSSGWNTLYQDPRDRRYWELTYPQSHLHGGGPPALRNISSHEAKKKYLISQ